MLAKIRGWKTFTAGVILIAYGFIATFGVGIPKDANAGLTAFSAGFGMIGLRHVTTGIAGWRITPPTAPAAQPQVKNG